MIFQAPGAKQTNCSGVCTLRTENTSFKRTVFLVFTWVWLLCPHLYKWTTPRGKTKQCLKRLKTPYVTTGAGSGERSTWTLSLGAFSHLIFKSADQFVKLQVFLVGWFLKSESKCVTTHHMRTLKSCYWADLSQAGAAKVRTGRRCCVLEKRISSEPLVHFTQLWYFSTSRAGKHTWQQDSIHLVVGLDQA